MTELAFWFLIIVIFYTYVGYPLVLVMTSFFIKRDIIKKDVEPTVSILIASYNEEKAIRGKIENTLALNYPADKLEIIVVSDGSTDKTDDIVRGFANQGGVRLFRVEGRVGKTEAQNQAVKTASGEIIIFSDATTYYEKMAIRNIVRNYVDSNVGAVSGRYRYIDPAMTQIGTGSIAFWDYENFIKTKQSAIKTITGCCGCIYSVRKDLYVALPRDIISDLVEPLKILEKGYCIIFEPEALAYETTCEKSEEEFRMRIRVISRGMQGIMYMHNLLNPFKYGVVSFQLFSHKILRWLVPFFAIFLYVLNIFLINKMKFYYIFFMLQSTFYLSAILGLIMERLGKKNKLLSLPLYFCTLNLASLIALIRTLLKKKEIVWETMRK